MRLSCHYKIYIELPSQIKEKGVVFLSPISSFPTHLQVSSYHFGITTTYFDKRMQVAAGGPHGKRDERVDINVKISL